MDGWNVGRLVSFWGNPIFKGYLSSKECIIFQISSMHMLYEWMSCLNMMVKPMPWEQPTDLKFVNREQKHKNKSWVRTWHPNSLEKHLNNSWKACFQLKKNTPLEKYHTSTPMILDFLRFPPLRPHVLQYFGDISSTCGWTGLMFPNIAKVWSWTVLSKVRPLVLLWSEWAWLSHDDFF